MTPGKWNQRGWTLVEMAVVLVIAALLATVTLQIMPLGIRLAEDDLAQNRLTQAEQALVGFARAHSRLPSADVTGDGREDPGASDGQLPYLTLGLPSGAAMAYSVPGSLNAAVDAYLYNPSIPVAGGTSPLPSVPPANGLDLCVLLGNQQRQVYADPAAGYSAAFAISHRLPDSGTGAIPLIAPSTPEQVSSAGTSLLYRSIGLGELYTRLDCSARLNRAFSTAQAAMTAQSALLLAQLDSDIADFYIEVATIENLLNVATYNLAVWNVANASFELAIGTAQAIPDIAPPTNLKKAALAVISIAKAINGLKGAITDLVEAEGSKAESEEKINRTRRHAQHAEDQARRLELLRDDATAKAKMLDNRGLNL